MNAEAQKPTPIQDGLFRIVYTPQPVDAKEPDCFVGPLRISSEHDPLTGSLVQYVSGDLYFHHESLLGAPTRTDVQRAIPSEHYRFHFRKAALRVLTYEKNPNEKNQVYSALVPIYAFTRLPDGRFKWKLRATRELIFWESPTKTSGKKGGEGVSADWNHHRYTGKVLAQNEKTLATFELIRNSPGTEYQRFARVELFGSEGDGNENPLEKAEESLQSHLPEGWEGTRWNLNIYSHPYPSDDDNDPIAQALKDADREWTEPELLALARWRIQEAQNGDKSGWTYPIACVPRIRGDLRGLMFDRRGGPAGLEFYETAVLATKWEFGDEPWFPNLEGKTLLSQKRIFARVAAHELGHMIGLEHSPERGDLMRSTSQAAVDTYPEIVFVEGDSDRLIPADGENRLVVFRRSIPDLGGRFLYRFRFFQSSKNKAGPISWFFDESLGDEFENDSYKSLKAFLNRNWPRFELNILKRIRFVTEIWRAVPAKKAPLEPGDPNQPPNSPEFPEPKFDFPDGIQLQFRAEDLSRLRHNPDTWVRSDTPRFSRPTSASRNDRTHKHGLELAVTPLTPSIPFGAPARVGLKLRNQKPNPTLAPFKIGFRSGLIVGEAIEILPDGSNGAARRFQTIKRDMDTEMERELAPGEHVESWLTILSGPQGYLFPKAGRYAIRVTLEWNTDVFVAVTTITVTKPIAEQDLELTRELVRNPEVFGAIAIGGVKKGQISQNAQQIFGEGTELIERASKDPGLCKHYQILDLINESRTFLERTNKETSVPESTAAPIPKYTRSELRDLGLYFTKDEFESLRKNL